MTYRVPIATGKAPGPGAPIGLPFLLSLCSGQHAGLWLSSRAWELAVSSYSVGSLWTQVRSLTPSGSEDAFECHAGWLADRLTKLWGIREQARQAILLLAESDGGCLEQLAEPTTPSSSTLQ